MGSQESLLVPGVQRATAPADGVGELGRGINRGPPTTIVSPVFAQLFILLPRSASYGYSLLMSSESARSPHERRTAWRNAVSEEPPAQRPPLRSEGP